MSKKRNHLIYGEIAALLIIAVTGCSKPNGNASFDPEEGCNQKQAGKEARVAYKAKYYFYISKP